VEFFEKKAVDDGGTAKRDQLRSLFNFGGEGSSVVGILLKERVVNLPALVALHELMSIKYVNLLN